MYNKLFITKVALKQTSIREELSLSIIYTNNVKSHDDVISNTELVQFLVFSSSVTDKRTVVLDLRGALDQEVVKEFLSLSLFAKILLLLRLQEQGGENSGCTEKKEKKTQLRTLLIHVNIQYSVVQKF